MSLETEMFDALAGNSNLNAVIGTRAYPHGTVPADVAKPYATWQEIAAASATDLDGSAATSSLDRSRVQVTLWSTKRTTARQGAVLVRAALEAASGVKAIFLDRRDMPFETDTKLHGVQQDFAVWLKT